MTILTAAEAQVALNLAGPSDMQLGLIEMLLPQIDAAIARVIQYDPTFQADVVEWYPSVELMSAGAFEGVWDTNRNNAYFQTFARANILHLRRIPVRAVSEVKVDWIGGHGQKPNTFGDNTIWTVGSQWYQDLIAAGNNATGHLFSIAGWPREPGSVKVTYSAGYSPDELRGRATVGAVDGAVPLDASPIFKAALLTLVKSFKTFVANANQARVGMAAGPLSSERLGAYSYTIDSTLISRMSGMQISVPPEALEDLQPFIHYGQIAL